MNNEAQSIKMTSALAMDQAFDFQGLSEKRDDTSSSEYRVCLENFEGPLDLLLHLIRKDQIDIHNIPVAHVCENYLNYLSRLTRPDVNIAGEFFVMAATLLQLKSEMLLPREVTEGEVEDPRLCLVSQLLEYERFKRAAAQLDARPWLNREIFARPEGAASDIIPPEAVLDGPVETVGTFELLLCLKVATDRTTRKPLQISVDTTSIRDRVVAVVPLIEGGNVVSFDSLLPRDRSRKEIILTFLAVLELARLKFIEITQLDMLGPIFIRAVRPLNDLNVGMLEHF